MTGLETYPIYVKHITTNKPIYPYMYSIGMKQTTSNQMGDGQNVFQVIINNSKLLTDNAIEQRQFVQQSIELLVGERIPVAGGRKFINMIARNPANKLKLKNVTRTFQALGDFGF